MAWVPIWMPPLTGCVYLSKKLNFSEAKFHLCLQDRVVNSSYLIGIGVGLSFEVYTVCRALLKIKNITL